MINSIVDLIDITNDIRKYLEGKISFDNNGWPIFLKQHFLDSFPELIVPYCKRNNKIVVKKEKTVICFFDRDSNIYTRYSKLLKEIGEYKKYMGVVVPDITVTRDMDLEMQEMIMLANQLFAAVLAVNGIKIVMNTRNGSTITNKCFKNIPRNIACASGFLGCNNSENYFEVSLYINKVMTLLPSKLMIYGKQDTNVNYQLDILGINYMYYLDFHQLSKRRESKI